jgi:hypothetical protein
MVLRDAIAGPAGRRARNHDPREGDHDTEEARWSLAGTTGVP